MSANTANRPPRRVTLGGANRPKIPREHREACRVMEPGSSGQGGMDSLAKELRPPWRRLLLGTNELVTHLIGVLLILGSIWMSNSPCAKHGPTKN
jgi:hypothetical protein